ncbi:MAG: lysostaphin resistance A-like protein [Sarcina sp.]
MKIIKRIISILLAAIGIPFLIYRCLIFANRFIFEIYCKMHNVSVYTLTQNQINDIMLKKTYLGSVLGEFLAVVILVVLFIFTGKSLYKRCNFKKMKPKKLSVIALIMIGFNFLALTFISYAQHFTTSYQGSEAAMHSAWFSPLELIGTIIIVPILEEILFRGAVFSVLKNNMNIYIAVLLQGIVFAFMHSMGGGIIQASYTFILGLLLLFASYYADSMLGDIFGHIVFNLFGLIIVPVIEALYFNPILYIVIGIALIVLGVILYRKDMKGQKLIIK